MALAEVFEAFAGPDAPVEFTAGGPRLLLHRMPPPPQEVTQARRRLAGRLHSKGRDAEAISHHYDVSNRFYEWVLGPSMAYTCACYPHQEAAPGARQLVSRTDHGSPARVAASPAD